MRRTAVVTLITALAVVACDDMDAGTSSDDASADVQAPAVDRSEVADIDLGFTRGQPNAPVAVVEFSDFGCPYCGQFARATFPDVMREYVDRGIVRWRYVPVVFGFPGGELMGSAALCAADQGGDDMFWRVHDLFYSRQAALRGDDARPALLEWLGELGVEQDALERCMDHRSTHAQLRRHREAAVGWYVRGTPTFVVNGVPMAGAAPIEFFRKVFATARDPSGL